MINDKIQPIRATPKLISRFLMKKSAMVLNVPFFLSKLYASGQ